PVRLSSSLTHSISRGPDEPPLLAETIPENLKRVVSHYGDHPAVIARTAANNDNRTSATLTTRETSLSYAALDADSSALAVSLQALGVKKGDRVAVSLGNTIEHATLSYAIFKLGAVLVPLNPSFNASQVGAALSHLGVQVLVIGAVSDRAYRPCQGRDNLALLQALVPDLASGTVESPQVPTLRRIVVLDNTDGHAASVLRVQEHASLTPYSALVGGSSSSSLGSASRPVVAVVPDAPLHPDDTVNIQFTSGTTSHPKAAMLTHTNILNNGYLIGRRMGLVPGDRIVCPPPLFHCFGSVLGFMATATSGAAILFPSPAFDPVASLRMALDHRATGLYGVATMFVSMLELLEDHHHAGVFTADEARQLPQHLSKGIAGGSSMPESLMRRLYGKLGLEELVICYGMTETSPVSCMTAPTDPLHKRTGSVGKVMPHTTVKIVDPGDRRRVMPIGQRGELAASGYLVMQGYWAAEDKTEEEKEEEEKDGQRRGRWWLYSGDEASMSEDGYVSITGRLKDLIIRGGENIHPLEIENVLFQHPLIAEASVVGVPDAKLGETVCAFIIPHAGVVTKEEDDEDEDGEGEENSQPGPPPPPPPPLTTTTTTLCKEQVRSWVRSQLSGHLVPRYIFWIDEYPKTASGKIQKFKLRGAAIDMIQ
ncbi:acetyl-CoA synthetase-like protein, partial [Cryphonectria parasitica EP155]